MHTDPDFSIIHSAIDQVEIIKVCDSAMVKNEPNAHYS